MPGALAMALIALTRHDRRQVTRDWLIMELEDIRLDDDTFRDLTSSGALEQHWRPQVRPNQQRGPGAALAPSGAS